MKSTRASLLLALCLIALPVFYACEKAPEQIPVESISVSESSAELIEGECLTLIAKIAPSNATNKNICWKSDNAGVATVDQDGNVIAVMAGKATISAISEDDEKKSASCVVTVKAKVIIVSSVTLSKTSVSLKVGETITLEAKVNPDDATDKTVSWSSSDGAVAIVSNGIVIAKKIGSAAITAKAGEKAATCTITVIPTEVESISLDKKEVSLKEGETIILSASVYPSDATNKNVSWSSSNKSVATVDASGKVTAMNAGTVTINATTEDGGKTASCKVTVIALVSSVSLNKAEMTLEEGSSETLTAIIFPDNASNKNVSWSSSNKSVAIVDASGKVTAVMVGTATVTVTTKDGGKKASCAVTVIPCPVESVSLNKTYLEINEGTSETLIATINPNRATNKKVNWSSSDATIATVNAYGMISAINEGSAIITVTTEDGNKTARCSVVVIGVNSIGEGGDIVTPDNRR